MSIQILTAAPDHLLTTLATVKSSLGITSSSKDNLLNDIIAGASAFAYSYTGRVFARETVKETLPGKGMPEVLLSRTPIVSVTTVKFDGGALTDYSILDVEAGILQRLSNFTNTNIPFHGITQHESPYYENKWEITYVGGYVLPGDAWTSGFDRNLPYDLERAVVALVTTDYKQNGKDATMTSYKIGETSASWGRNVSAAGGDLLAIGLPPSAIRTLNLYRRVY